MKASIFVVEDDVAVGKVITAILRQAGHEATHFTRATPALAACEKDHVDLVISDLRLPGMDGMAFLEAAHQRVPGLPILLLTAHGNVPTAVEAMRRGAADFLQKPADREALLHVVDKHLAARPVAPGAADGDGARCIGTSPAFEEVRAQAARVAATKSTVLLLGETGTGKEVIARFIHERSPRRDAPFIVTNCGALPENLIESELFGHERGAFTGATHARPGRVTLADGGTLFLDEVGELPLPAQVKLLRVLQEREVQAVGARGTKPVDIRVIAATHRDLEADIEAGRFRADLYYRLAVFPLALPTLAQRRGDIRLLAEHFLREHGRELGRALTFAESGLSALERHRWPGNVRELRNAVERMAILADDAAIDAAAVERALRFGTRASQSSPPHSMTLDERRIAAERDALMQALERTGGNRSKAARMLGISRRSLYYKLNEYELDV